LIARVHAIGREGTELIVCRSAPTTRGLIELTGIEATATLREDLTGDCDRIDATSSVSGSESTIRAERFVAGNPRGPAAQLDGSSPVRLELGSTRGERRPCRELLGRSSYPTAAGVTARPGR
jgi:hypothetical protein